MRSNPIGPTIFLTSECTQGGITSQLSKLLLIFGSTSISFYNGQWSVIEEGCHSTRPPPREFLYLPSLPLGGKKTTR